jgi:hypothetical protein
MQEKGCTHTVRNAPTRSLDSKGDMPSQHACFNMKTASLRVIQDALKYIVAIFVPESIRGDAAADPRTYATTWCYFTSFEVG